MATTNGESEHYGPSGATENLGSMNLPYVFNEQQEKFSGEGEKQRDKEKHSKIGESDNALGTRTSATDGNERYEKNNGTTLPYKQKNNNGYEHMKRLGQIIKDMAKTAKAMSFDDLDEQKFELYKQAVYLAGEYVEWTLNEQEETRKRTEQQTSSGPPTTAQHATWAQRAAVSVNRPAPYGPAHAIPPSQVATGEAREKRVMVKIRSEEHRKGIEQATPAQLKDLFQNGGDVPGGDIVAARRSQEGGIILHMASREAKKRLENNEEGIRRACPSAHITKPIFKVAVDSVRVDAFDDNDQGACIEKLKRENKALHAGLNIRSVEWPRFAYTPKSNGEAKKYSTLIVEVESPEKANKLIADGIVENSQLLSCRKWESTNQPKQCYNCQQYGHIQGSCQRPTRCGRCAGAHRTHDHKGQGRPTCEICGGEHEAWDARCQVRQREMDRLRRKRENAPRWFKEPPMISGLQAVNETSPQEEGWKKITSKRKHLGEIPENRVPRKVGRPPKPLERETGQTNLHLYRTTPVTETTGTGPQVPSPNYSRDTAMNLDA